MTSIESADRSISVTRPEFRLQLFAQCRFCSSHKRPHHVLDVSITLISPPPVSYIRTLPPRPPSPFLSHFRSSLSVYLSHSFEFRKILAKSHSIREQSTTRKFLWNSNCVCVGHLLRRVLRRSSSACVLSIPIPFGIVDLKKEKERKKKKKKIGLHRSI